MKKFVLALFVVFFVVSAIQSCNTVKGVGKDIEKAGEAIQKTVK